MLNIKDPVSHVDLEGKNNHPVQGTTKNKRELIYITCVISQDPSDSLKCSIEFACCDTYPVWLRVELSQAQMSWQILNFGGVIVSYCVGCSQSLWICSQPKKYYSVMVTASWVYSLYCKTAPLVHGWWQIFSYKPKYQKWSMSLHTLNILFSVPQMYEPHL